MRADSQPPSSGVIQLGSSDCVAFFNELRASRAEIIPVVGAGLGLAAGAPSADELAQHILRVADLTNCSERPALFDLASAAAARHGEAWLQDVVAAFIESRHVRSSPILQALSKVQTGLILTTNYDLAIESAARAVGRDVTPLTLDDLPSALHGSETLRVVHLHGIISNPRTIILSPNTYEAALQDERMQLITRALGSGFRFLFLGHSLSENEQHLRRDISWAARVRSGSGHHGKHLLLNHAQEGEVSVVAQQARLLQEAGVQAVFIEDRGLRFRSVDVAANILAGPSGAVRNLPAASIRDARDLNYLPLPVAELSPDVDGLDGTAEGRYLWKVHTSGHTLAHDLDDRVPRLLLLAGGGYGKTQELHQIGFRSHRPALYKRLRSFRITGSEPDPAVAFVREMDDAESYQRVDKLDIAALETSSYVFLLDGLDEVRAMDRPVLRAFLQTVSSSYPQHRFVVATRLMASSSSRLDGFTTYTLKPDNLWLERYAESRAVQRQDLREYIDRSPGISELSSIPIYASAIVDRVLSPESGSLTPLSMILSTATGEIDPRINVRPESLDLWLNRIALYMQTSNEISITLDDLVSSGLHLGLGGIYPDSHLLDELAERARLLVKRTAVSFVANIVQEARAASAVLSMGDGGLAFLSRFVVLPRGGTFGVRAARESWSHTLWLLYPHATAPVRELIQDADPLLAARAAVTTTDPEERTQAMRTIWQAYSERQIWLDRNHAARYQDDESAMEELARAGLASDFKTELIEALKSQSRIQRGNALIVLNAASVPELRTRLVQLIGDADPVVRRRAAMVALSAEVHELSGPLAEQAYLDHDQMARETLIGCAIDLAESEIQAVAIADQAPPSLRRQAMDDLFSRIGRARSLELVEENILRREALLDSAVRSMTFDAAQSWSDNDLIRLARIYVALPEATAFDSEMNALLRQRPMIVIREWLKFPLSDRIDFEFFWLVDALSTSELEQLEAELIAGNRPELVHATSRTLVHDRVADALQRRLSSSHETAEPHHSREDSPTLRELIRSGDRAQALSFNPSDSAQLDPGEAAVVKEWVKEAIARVRPRFAPAPMEGRSDSSWSNLARWAGHLHVGLSAGQWPAATRFELERGESGGIAWIRQQSRPESWQALHQVVDEWPRLTTASLAVVVDENSRPLYETIYTAIIDCDAPHGLKEELLQKLADNGDKEVIRHLLRGADQLWMLPTLAKLGDCDAEAKLLALHARSTRSLLAVVAHRPWRPWVQDMSCPSSAPLLFKAIRRALVEATEVHELEIVMRALDRCAGPNVASYYDALISDQEIPGAAFLFYQKRTALDSLIEKLAQEVIADRDSLVTNIAEHVK